MKTFIAMLAIIFAIFTTMPDAEARKFGGKRSFGKSQPTQTQQKQTATDQSKQSTSQKTSKKGLLGGMLGGLLMGGLIASMMGGAFEGFQMMDFVIIAGIAFVLFKLFKLFNQSKARAQLNQAPAFASEQGQFKQQIDTPPNPTNTETVSSGGGFATSTEQVPFNLPADFDLNGFLEGSRSHYKTLQQAWNDNDLNKIQEYVSNEMFNELTQQLRELDTSPNTEVMFLDAELVRAEHNDKLAQISVKFSGRYRDTAENLEEDINEVWHLERQLEQTDAPWLIVGIENN